MLLPLLAVLTACNPGAASPAPGAASGATPVDDHAPAPLPAVGPGQAVAVFAGGCFWCMESDFDKLPGVVATTSGYAGGHLPHPTYGDVNTEMTGHKEAVRVVYDTSKLTYAQVLDYYWHHVDPTDDMGQFCDRGDSYVPVVFYADDAQKQAAEASKKAIDDRQVLSAPIATPILPVGTFWPAELYHQDYHATNTGHYEAYRLGCGRDAKVKQVWARDLGH
jgi:peptide-methionine (S)-S-oxide reductase